MSGADDCVPQAEHDRVRADRDRLRAELAETWAAGDALAAWLRDAANRLVAPFGVVPDLCRWASVRGDARTDPPADRVAAPDPEQYRRGHLDGSDLVAGLTPDVAQYAVDVETRRTEKARHELAYLEGRAAGCRAGVAAGGSSAASTDGGGFSGCTHPEAVAGDCVDHEHCAMGGHCGNAMPTRPGQDTPTTGDTETTDG